MRAQMSDGDGASEDELRPAEPWSDGDASEDPGKVARDYYDVEFEVLPLPPYGQ
jgi:hypothetical protein